MASVQSHQHLLDTLPGNMKISERASDCMCSQAVRVQGTSANGASVNSVLKGAIRAQKRPCTRVGEHSSVEDFS